MWTADVPSQPIEPPAIYMAANESVSQPAGTAHKLGVCRIVKWTATPVSPILDAGTYVGRYIGEDTPFHLNPDGSRRADFQLRIIKQPEHGELEKIFPEATNFLQYRYTYIPNEEPDDHGNDYYIGKDYFVVEVSAGGVTVEIHYTMSVNVGQPDYIVDDNDKPMTDPRRCADDIWKISLNPAPND